MTLEEGSCLATCSHPVVHTRVPIHDSAACWQQPLTFSREDDALMHTPSRINLASLSWWVAALAAFLLVTAVVLGY